MSFAEVSMASARLQSMARLLSDRHPDEANHRGGAILLIVTAREQHTLGAVVLSVWLKRNRVPHRLVIAPDEREIARVLTSDAFEGVFISVAAGEQLSRIAETVAFIRAALPAPRPIVVGGAALTYREDVEEITGADLATNDPESALGFCGIGTKGTAPT